MMMRSLPSTIRSEPRMLRNWSSSATRYAAVILPIIIETSPARHRCQCIAVNGFFSPELMLYGKKN